MIAENRRLETLSFMKQVEETEIFKESHTYEKKQRDSGVTEPKIPESSKAWINYHSQIAQ